MFMLGGLICHFVVLRLLLVCVVLLVVDAFERWGARIGIGGMFTGDAFDRYACSSNWRV